MSDISTHQANGKRSMGFEPGSFGSSFLILHQLLVGSSRPGNSLSHFAPTKNIFNQAKQDIFDKRLAAIKRSLWLIPWILSFLCPKLHSLPSIMSWKSEALHVYVGPVQGHIPDGDRKRKEPRNQRKSNPRPFSFLSGRPMLYHYATSAQNIPLYSKKSEKILLFRRRTV